MSETTTRRRTQREKPAVAILDPGGYEPDVIELPECPDKQPKAFALDARIWEGRWSDGRLVDHRLRHYRNRAELESRHVQLRETLKKAGIREDGVDWWSRGCDDVPYYANGSSPLTEQFIPLLPGPWSRQQYWADYFATSAKTFEAYHHDPLAHRSVEMQIEFLLGRGVEAVFDDEGAQKQWDGFAKATDLARRLEDIVRDLAVFGEVMLRWFPERDVELEDGTTQTVPVVRLLDPASVYEIVTDQEDWETVYFYHQQFTTRMQAFAPPTNGNGAPTGPSGKELVKYIVRQIPAEEVDHWRVNATSGEVRGRPDLFPALGWIKRLRDLMTAKVVKADMEARMVFKIMADATPAELAKLQAAMFPGGRAPNPGTVVSMNKLADLQPFQFQAQASGGRGGDPTVDMLLSLIAVGVGVPKEYLVMGGGGTRATALVATEPGAKRFEKRQELIERILHQMADRVVGPDKAREFTFPSIATEDRTSKLQDLAYSEGMDWISKRTAAETAAKELGFTTYDFEAEQKEIADEFADAQDEGQGDGKIRRSMILSSLRQVPKLDVTKGAIPFEDEPPGLQVSTGGQGASAAPGLPNGQQPGGSPTQPATRAGFPADENPASQRGAANIARDNRAREAATIALTPEQLAVVLREARAPRRRPDDPHHRAAAASFKERTAENVAQLLKEGTGAVSSLPDALRERMIEELSRETAERVEQKLGRKAMTEARLVEAIKDLSERPVQVEMPEGAVKVTVEAPPAPTVELNPDLHVHVPEQKPRRRRVIRDKDGQITGIEEE
jgi:hypothetical protein